MRTLEPDIQPQPSSGPQPADAQSTQEQTPPSTEHFSPDPLERTDRYRLVTPYQLGPED